MTDPTPPAEGPPPLGDASRPLVEAAQLEASTLGHGFVGTEHLLLALMADPALAEAAAARGFPARDALREKLASGAPPKGGASGESGLSSHARRLLEQAERTSREAGGVAIDRRWILDRLVSNPRGPLARVIAKPASPASPEAGTVAPSPPDAPTAPRQEPRERKGRGERNKGPEPAAAPAERPPRERQRDRDRDRDRPSTDRNEPRGRERPGKGAPPPEARPEPPARERRPVAPIRSRPARAIGWRAAMLLLVPAGLAMHFVLASPPALTFLVACLGVIPLAGYMGEATEHLAERTGPAMGGLLNATFGNAAELIIAVVALNAGLVTLVKASIIGSILGNLLLIMGLSFVAGGVGRPTVRFSRVASGASAGMLALAVAGMGFPAMLHLLEPGRSFEQELPLSETVAVVLVATYLFSLLFTLRTHRALFGEPHPTTHESWGIGRALGVLALATAGVVVQSEILVQTVEAVTVTLGLSEVFLGLIIIPLIGNAAEHATAIVVARKGQMDLSLSIALGSSTQVALLVAPVLVGVGLLLGQPMDLVFSPLEMAALAMATIVTAIITLDGEGHWYEGIQLLALYLLIAAAAFFL